MRRNEETDRVFRKDLALHRPRRCLGNSLLARAQDDGSRFVVDPNWPKLSPGKWVIGQVRGVCVGAQDHAFVANRDDLTDKEAEVGQQAPPCI
jgi:hypothetical protein